MKKVERLKEGDRVVGNLIPKAGTVIATGTYPAVARYDVSGAMKESIQLKHVPSSAWCVAVRHQNGAVAVYPRDEVWKA